jgi:hypothetical protein
MLAERHNGLLTKRSDLHKKDHRLDAYTHRRRQLEDVQNTSGGG